MTKREKLLSILCVVLTLSLALVATQTTFAKDVKTKTITALQNYTIEILYNGDVQVLRDANQKVIYPISFEGSTYVPIRAISTIFGETVDYDKENYQVILGTQTGDLDLTKGMTNDTTHSHKITQSSELTVDGRTFKNGIVYEIWNGVGSGTGTTWGIPVSIKGREHIKFTAYTDVDSILYIYNQDQGKQANFELTAGEFKEFEVDVKGVTEVRFVANGAKTGSKGKVYVFEPTAY